MNGAHTSLVLIAASIILAGAARAQDQSALTRQGVSTNSTTGVTVQVPAQPAVPWAEQGEVSGLLIDLVRPQETWSLLNPAAPMPTVPPPQWQPDTQVPAAISGRDSNIMNGGPNFAFLRFSFR